MTDIVMVRHGDRSDWRQDVPGARFWELSLAQVALTFFRLAANTRFPPHAHDSEQITLVLAGRLTLTVDGREYVLEPGDAIAIPAGVAHAVQAGDTPVEAIDAWSPPPTHLGV